MGVYKDATRSSNDLVGLSSKTHMPKSFRMTAAGNIIATDFSGATHILVDILNRPISKQEIVYDLFGVSVSALTLPCGGKTGVYFELDQYINPRNTEVVALIAAHFSEYPVFYNDPASLDNIKLYVSDQVKQQNTKIQQKIKVEEIKNLEKTKISGEHHIHFTAQEIWDTLNDKERKRARLALCLPADSSTTFVAGTMTWLATLSDEMVKLVLDAGLFQAQDQKQFGRIGKAISVRAKSLQNTAGEDLRPLFEIDVLINRYLGEPIWDQEKENRTNPNLAQINPGKVYREAVRLFSRVDNHKEKVRKLKWDDYWAARWQWSATGSIHSQYDEDGKYIAKERELKNKFISLCKIPKRNIEHFLNRKPEIRAWTSTKYEWAKLRAIYGTDLTSYVLTHFVFYNCEDTLPSQFPVGKKARPSYVSASVDAVLQHREAFCLDFEDFNSQHSNENMQAVMQAWLDVNKDGLSEEQFEAGKWAVQSVANTIIEDRSGTKTTYKSEGTLMSGWRLTTFINSVLNYIYTQACTVGVKEAGYSVHNGDDVLMGINRPSTLAMILTNARERNVRIQKTKCAFGGIAEFLRVDHRRGEFGQYVTRSVATLMHARIESKMAISTVDYVEAMESRLFDFNIRTENGSLTSRLRKTYYERLSELYELEEDDLFKIKTTHRVAGGISENPLADVDCKVELEEGVNTVELEKELPGVRDYSEKLVRDLEMDQEAQEVYKNIYKSTLDAVQLVRRKCKLILNDRAQQYRVLRGIYGAYSDMKGDTVLGKAMLTGFAFDVLNKSGNYGNLMSMVAASSNKMQYLRTVC